AVEQTLAGQRVAQFIHEVAADLGFVVVAVVGKDDRPFVYGGVGCQFKLHRGVCAVSGDEDDQSVFFGGVVLDERVEGARDVGEGGIGVGEKLNLAFRWLLGSAEAKAAAARGLKKRGESFGIGRGKLQPGNIGFQVVLRDADNDGVSLLDRGGRGAAIGGNCRAALNFGQSLPFF